VGTNPKITRNSIEEDSKIKNNISLKSRSTKLLSMVISK
jgi:hypothetical protein